MTGMTYSKFYASDWRNGTLYHLTVEEEGLYIRCCAYMWDTGECLPTDDRLASRLVNLQIQKYQKLMAALIDKGKMTRGQGVIFNERVLEDISEFQRQSGHQSLRAKRGHETRKLTALAVKELMEEVARLKEQLSSRITEPPQQPPTQPPHQPPVARTGGTPGGGLEVPPQVRDEKSNKNNEAGKIGHPAGTAEEEEEEEEEKEKKDICAIGIAPTDLQLENEPDDRTPPNPGLPPVIAESFEAFWKAFPAERRRGKGKCRAMFAAIVTGRGKYAGRRVLAADLIAAVKAGAGIDPKFPPMPETWLNQGRWEDAPASAEPDPVDGKAWGWWRGKEPTFRNLPVDRWRAAFASHQPNGTWPWWLYGPPPGHAECLVPRELVAEFGWEQIYRGSITHG